MYPPCRHAGTSRPGVSLGLLPFILTFAALLSGCGGESRSSNPTQVAATVNDGEITIRQVQHALQGMPAEPPDVAGQTARRALDALIERELAAQEARKRGLDRDPRVVQAMESAKREVLARAYNDSLAEKASLPSSDEIDRYYDSQPALFGKRRLYTLHEVSVEGTAEHLVALRGRIESAPDVAHALDVLREAGRPFSARQLAVAPEDIPMALLSRLSELKDGQSLLVPQPAGAKVLTVLESRAAPLSREAARGPIRAFLVNEQKRHAVNEGMKALRQTARVTYVGPFAHAASRPASGAAITDAR